MTIPEGMVTRVLPTWRCIQLQKKLSSSQRVIVFDNKKGPGLVKLTKLPNPHIAQPTKNPPRSAQNCHVLKHRYTQTINDNKIWRSSARYGEGVRAQGNLVFNLIKIKWEYNLQKSIWYCKVVSLKYKRTKKKSSHQCLRQLSQV